MKLKYFILQIIGMVSLTIVFITNFIFNYSKIVTTILVLISLSFIIVGNLILRASKKNDY
jgi:hypothetical protein